MAEIYLTCNSGSLFSPVFTVDNSKRMFLAVPSLAVATAVTLQFTATSGAAPWLAVGRMDGGGAVHTVASGPGPAFAPLPQLPSPWGRIAYSNSQTNVHTLTILPTAARW